MIELGAEFGQFFLILAFSLSLCQVVFSWIGARRNNALLIRAARICMGLILATVTGAMLCLTIIGIPLGIGSFKMVPISLMPLGKEIVPVDQAAGASRA